jgi:thiamine biosynthesis protein ThiS
MQICLNGQSREVSVDTTVSTLLLELNLGNTPIAVELNGEILPKTRFGQTRLKDLDRVEVVRFVGGG